MSQFDRYFEIKEKVIRPALKGLKKEYEAQGYKCFIGSKAPPDVRSKALSSQLGTPPIRSVIEPISFSRIHLNGVTHTVSIYTWDGNLVIFNRLDAVYGVSVLLNDISPNRVKEEVRKALD